MINAMNKVATSFNPFMYSRVLYLHHTLDYVLYRRDFGLFPYMKQTRVVPMQYIPTQENIAYIAIRSEISLVISS